MNVQQRNANFLALTAHLLKPSPAHVKAVATEIGCPELVDGACNHKGECFCAKAAAACLSVRDEA